MDCREQCLPAAPPCSTVSPATAVCLAKLLAFGPSNEVFGVPLLGEFTGVVESLEHAYVTELNVTPVDEMYVRVMSPTTHP